MADTGEVVPNSYQNQLYIQSKMQMQPRYKCEFKIGKLEEDFRMRFIGKLFSPRLLSTLLNSANLHFAA